MNLAVKLLILNFQLNVTDDEERENLVTWWKLLFAVLLTKALSTIMHFRLKTYTFRYV